MKVLNSNIKNVIHRLISSPIKHCFIHGQAYGFTSIEDILENDKIQILPPVSVDPHDVAAVPFSSGTTGVAKGKYSCIRIVTSAVVTI